MKEPKTPVLRVIEPGDQPVRCPPERRFGFTPQQARYYNEHPIKILEDFSESDQIAALREIQRHVREWESQQTPEQAEWMRLHRMRGYRSTLSAVDAILDALKR